MTTNSPFRAVLKKTLSHALNYLENLEDEPAAATATVDELRNRLVKPLASQGMSAEQVIDELISDTAGGIVGSAGGRFFGWVVGGALPASLAADWLTSTWDQNAALYASGPAEAVVEEVCGVWLKDLLGIPADASFGLVTGCQMAHFTCLAAARNAVLEKYGWDVEHKGLTGAPPIRVLSGNQRHGSIERALRYLGLGLDCAIALPVDIHIHLQPETLAKALAENPSTPTIVMLQAGDLHTGAFDPFNELIPIAHEYGAWVHVDGAFGLWAAATSKYAHLMEGASQADSWATDGHKWLNVPYDSGFVFVRDTRAHRASMSHQASYLPNANAARDQMNWNPEWSRRGRGFATYAAIRQLGREGIAAMVENCCMCAHEIVKQIGELPGAEVIWEPIINQGLVRFPDPSPDATELDHDRKTDRVIAAIQADGDAFFSGSSWGGMRVMRVSVSGWQTGEAEVERTVAAVKRALKSCN